MRFDFCTIEYSHRTQRHTQTITPGEKRALPGLSAVFHIKKHSMGMRYTISLDSDIPVEIHRLALSGMADLPGDNRVICNGFQSWSGGRVYSPGERMRGINPAARLFKADRYGDYRFINYPRRRGRFFSHAYCCIVDPRGAARFAGSLAEEAGYTMFQVDAATGRIAAEKECQEMMLMGHDTPMDVLVLFGSEDEVFHRYFRELGIDAIRTNPCTGWTSWYNHYTGINETIIMENLECFSRRGIPLDYFQVDDGYQTAVGDWQSVKPAFPGGMGYLAREIKKRGYRPGIWLAPFICEKNSVICRTQKDWLLQGHDGRPVAAGWNPRWSGDFYCLDIHHRMVREYLREVFDTVFRSWKYDMVKLDFLYAAAMIPRRGQSRGTIMVEAMAFLRRLTGRKTMLACGVPLSAAFGRTDYCRVGNDVSLWWENRILAAAGIRERVSTVNSLRSAVARRHLNGRAFMNDPDVFILRDENNHMNLRQRRTLFILNNIFGGMIFTSDDIDNYSPATMRLFLSMYPLRKKENIRVVEERGLYLISFSVGKLDYTVLANLTGRRRKALLGGTSHYRFDPYLMAAEYRNPHETVELAPYDTLVFLRLSPEPYTVAGSTAHLFPGCEIDTLASIRRRITLRQNRMVKIPNRIALRVPEAGTYVLNGATINSEEAARGVHIITMSL